MKYLNKRVWQVAFLLFGTSWLFAPAFNHLISERTSLVSQYEVSFMPYSWLFKSCDIIAALLLVLASVYLLTKRRKDASLITLLVIAILMAIDALAPTKCTLVGNICQEYSSVSFIIHAIESVLSAFLLFGLTARSALKERLVPSVLFVIFQIFYVVLFVTSLADNYKFNTLSQFIYQTLTILWLAWYVGHLYGRSDKFKNGRIIRLALAWWVALNGIFAIALDLLHPAVINRYFEHLFFVSNQEWITQHGVVVGVALLYLSRHVSRGEKRARQLVLVLFAIEVMKYAAITPQPILVLLYSVSFAMLFAFGEDYFYRSHLNQRLSSRLADVLVVLGGATAGVSIAGYFLWQSPKFRHMITLGFNHYGDFILDANHFTHSHLPSVVFARTFTALIAALAWFILWALFKPAPNTLNEATEEVSLAKDLVKKHANSSEDFFKIWPTDKQYFFNKNQTAFIAYKVTGPIAFALSEPVASSKTASTKIITEFIAFCRQHGWRACFINVQSRSENKYLQLKKLKVGSSAVVEINKFCEETVKNKWWRWQHNKATRTGYQYKKFSPPHSAKLIEQCRKVSNAWLERDGRQERTFALGYFNEEYLQQSVLHTLYDQNDQMIAFINELPIFNNLNQTTIDLIRFIPSENSIMPFLLESTLKQLQEEGRFSYFDLGFVPLAKVKSRIANIARALSTERFSSSGLEQFKGKFEPDWQPNFIAYDGDLADIPLIAINLDKAMELK